jgi:hypothetical protein
VSNYLAIATVTATLQRFVQSVIGTDVPGAKATTARPDASGQGLPEVGVNIFLYQTVPNAVLRNADLPTRNSTGGQSGQRPTVALDLHYLMSFYGADGQLEPQRVLGSVVRSLHSRPLLTRQMIRDTVTDPAYSFLATSDLADAVDLVRLSPLSFTLEEFSKLWSVMLQTPYALSVAYSAAAVLIEDEVTPVVPLPVRERQVIAVPFQQPVIASVNPQIIAAGAALTINGQNLRGDVTKIKFGDTLALPATVGNQKITVTLPATLQPGVCTVQVIHDFDFGTANEPHRGFESNAMPFILQPTITTPPPFTAARGATLILEFAPPVGREQSVTLLIGDEAIPLPTRLPTDPPTATTLTFAIPTTFSPGTFFLRVRVDGAESSLTMDNSKPFPAYNGPPVTIT